jgi:hypothetical protein
VVLAAVTLTRPLLAIRQVSLLPEGKGSISASFGDELVSLQVLESGSTIYAGSAPFATLVALALVPPLVMWGIWLWRRQQQPAGMTGSLETRGVNVHLPRERAESLDARARDRERAHKSDL